MRKQKLLIDFLFHMMLGFLFYLYTKLVIISISNSFVTYLLIIIGFSLIVLVSIKLDILKTNNLKFFHPYRLTKLGFFIIPILLWSSNI